MSKSIAISYSMKKKKKKEYKKEHGGSEFPSVNTKGVNRMSYEEPGRSQAGSELWHSRNERSGESKKHHLEYAKKEHKKVLNEIRSDKTDRKNLASGGAVSSGDPTMNYAEGGEADDGGAPAWVCSKCGEHGNTFKGYQDGSKALDMISKILDKRKAMSKGGQVANDTDFTADTLPNEFDDLVLRDDEEMEGYTGKNSGDEIGGPSKEDTVSRAMLKRKAKKKA